MVFIIHCILRHATLNSNLMIDNSSVEWFFSHMSVCSGRPVFTSSWLHQMTRKVPRWMNMM